MSLCIGSFSLVVQHRVKMVFSATSIRYIFFFPIWLFLSSFLIQTCPLIVTKALQQLLFIVRYSFISGEYMRWWGREYFAGVYPRHMLQGLILEICSKDRCLCLINVNVIKQRFLVKDFIFSFPSWPLKTTVLYSNLIWNQGKTIGHWHDGVILLPWPESFRFSFHISIG